MQLQTCLGAALTLCLALAAGPGAAEDATPPRVEDGREVSIEYTLTLDDGTVADTNVGGEPLTFVQGAGKTLPALEQGLDGLETGASRKVDVPPQDAYGPVDPTRVETVATSSIPEDARQVGARLVAQSRDGQQRSVRVKELRGEQVVIDFNHPLAGQTLHFDVKVLEIK